MGAVAAIGRRDLGARATYDARSPRRRQTIGRCVHNRRGRLQALCERLDDQIRQSPVRFGRAVVGQIDVVAWIVPGEVCNLRNGLLHLLRPLRLLTVKLLLEALAGHLRNLCQHCRLLVAKVVAWLLCRNGQATDANLGALGHIGRIYEHGGAGVEAAAVCVCDAWVGLEAPVFLQVRDDEDLVVDEEHRMGADGCGPVEEESRVVVRLRAVLGDAHDDVVVLGAGCRDLGQRGVEDSTSMLGVAGELDALAWLAEAVLAEGGSTGLQDLACRQRRGKVASREEEACMQGGWTWISIGVSHR